MRIDTLESLQSPVHYDSFLLRTWRPATGSRSRWMIENVMTGERHTFTELADLVLFLRDQARGMADERCVGRPTRHRRPGRQVTPATDVPGSAEE